MSRQQAHHSFARLLPLGLLAFASCHNSSGSGPGAQALGTFSIETVTVFSGETNVPLNRPIIVTFNRALDFSTVTQNTFQLAVSPGEFARDPETPGLLIDVGGLPALGEFALVNDRTLRFQPSCPLDADLLDSGLLRGVQYTLKLPSVPADGVSMAGLGGGVLDVGFTGTFTTSNSGSLTDLFSDLTASPPEPVIRDQGDPGTQFTRLEFGGDALGQVFLDRAAMGAPGLLPPGTFAPLNLYSDPSSRVDVILVIDQAINPGPRNLAKLRLEFRPNTPLNQWFQLPADVVLERNCGSAGAEVRLIPLAPLPQGSTIRIVMDAEFEDLTGQRALVELNDFVQISTATALDPGTQNPGDAADEIFEPFTLSGDVEGSLEDTRVRFEVPSADWNKDESGALRGAYLFENGGGPGGNFDLVIPSMQDSIFNTFSQSFVGGPNGLPTAVQVAENGVLHVRDLTLEAGARWRVVGPNPVTILASGNVRIDGALVANGGAAAPIFTLNTTNLPTPGAAGVAGGGTGGTGSFLTTRSTPRGGAGRGGINSAVGGGGGGGESGIATTTSNSGENRRPGGGGGGVFGPDTLLVGGCADERYIGLNAETGHLGASTAQGAITNMSPPQGGVTGPGPFVDSMDDNDFWGSMLFAPGTPNQAMVLGELDRPWAGAGGGAGGDATNYSAAIGYPDPNFPLNREDKGAGGGGGGGSITILALGTISFGPDGRIEANGGTGAGGENTNFVNRVGGGSGGGSGGHVILQSGTAIDFSEVPVPMTDCPINFSCLAISALGGQGGAGANNAGGFDPNNGTSGNPVVDSKPAMTNSMGSPCPSSPRICAGGDGGPGVVQLHAPTLGDIIPPGSLLDSTMVRAIKPAPVGLHDLSGVWEGLMLPSFGDVSRARSKWIRLGEMRVAPGSSMPDVVEYLFRGIDPVTGAINTTNEVVDALPPILDGALAASGTFPYVAADGFTVVFDVTDLTGADDLYRRNPNLMRFFELTLDQGAQVETFEVVSVNADEAAGEVRLTVLASASGARPVDFSLGAQATLTPRFFGIETDGVSGFLPDSARVSIRFQAAPKNALGRPDVANATPLTSDIVDLTESVSNADFEFFRFVVDFDVATGATPTAATNPVPSLDFLRVSFRF